jgi:hypothetical protein
MTDIDGADARRNNEFDFDQATLLLPPRTDVLAYIDNHGDLWISASDAARRCDTELRINAEDVAAFIDGLTDLIGVPSVGRPAEPKPAPKTSHAERQRRYREKKRHASVTESVTRDVTQGEFATLPLLRSAP